MGHFESPGHLWRTLLGLVLRERRHALRRTLAQVAQRSGVSVQYLSEVERGLKDPSSEVIAAIAGALGLTLLDLTRRVGDLAAADQQRVVTLPAITQLQKTQLQKTRSHASRVHDMARATPTMDTQFDFSGRVQLELAA